MTHHAIVEKKRAAYLSVYERLYDMIVGGELPSGMWLPSEPKLAATLGVSRMTLRQALALLQEDGLILKHQGKGNQVSTEQRVAVSGIGGMNHPIHQSSILPIDRVELDFRIEVPTDYQLNQLQRNTSVSVAADRWYFSGETFVAYSITLLPIETITHWDIALHCKEELHKFLEETIYDSMHKSRLKIQITKAGNEVSSRCAKTEDDPILLINETIYHQFESTSVALCKHYLLPEFFSLELERNGNSPQKSQIRSAQAHGGFHE
ncbi:MAG: GntR family transcriptional regulator [Eubacteriales bacterium]